MKKSLMFLFTLLISLAMLGVGNRSNAFVLSEFKDIVWGYESPAYNVPTFSDDFSIYCGRYMGSSIYTNYYSTNSNDKFISSYNSNCNMVRGYIRTSTDSNNIGTAFNINWIGRTTFSNGIIFEWMVDNAKLTSQQQSSWSGFVQTFPDGNEYLMDEVFFRHDSIIFRNSETKRTFQRIGGYGLFNKVVIANPWSPTSNTQNLWLIDFRNNKARSASVTREVASQFMLGQIPISPTVLSAQTWENSYTLGRGGSNFFPNLDGFNSYRLGSQSLVYDSSLNGYILDMNGGYTYSYDSSIGNPDFDNENPVTINTGSQTELYNDCFGRYNTVSMVANDWFSCQNQGIANIDNYTGIVSYVMAYSGDDSVSPSDITSNLTCQSFILDARWLYSLYSDSYSSLIQIARRSSSIPNGVDVAGYCGNRPTENSSVWSDILDFLGLGDDGRFQNTREYLENLVYDTVYTNLRNPISTTFEEGFSKYGNQQCHAPIVSTSYGNIVLYFFGAVLIFVFLIFL